MLEAAAVSLLLLVVAFAAPESFSVVVAFATLPVGIFAGLLAVAEELPAV